MNVLNMKDVDLANRRVIIREDLNVPMQDGQITDLTRIEKSLPTIQYAIKSKAKIIILSHLGRPKEGQFDPQYSLAPVAKALSTALGQDVQLSNNWLDGIEIKPGQVILAENVRFLPGEEKNDPSLAKKMANQGDIFVMDAFATAHRAQASTVGISEYAKVACAGFLLLEELEALSKTLENPARPLVAIVGGSKVSTKLHLLENLLTKVNRLIVGGGIANTFLAATGMPVGKSLYEPEWLEKALILLEKAVQLGVDIPLPQDVVVGQSFDKNTPAIIKPVAEVQPNEMILDIGPQTAKNYTRFMADAKTIVWNGPVGVFEFPAFSQGTKTLAKAVTESSAYSIAGGGDTLAALAQFGLSDKISYISTGGGAFLEFLEGVDLPAVRILIKRAQSS